MHFRVWNKKKICHGQSIFLSTTDILILHYNPRYVLLYNPLSWLHWSRSGFSILILNYVLNVCIRRKPRVSYHARVSVLNACRYPFLKEAPSRFFSCRLRTKWYPAPKPANIAFVYEGLARVAIMDSEEEDRAFLQPGLALTWWITVKHHLSIRCIMTTYHQPDLRSFAVADLHARRCIRLVWEYFLVDDRLHVNALTATFGRLAHLYYLP